jgi:hypothetical protein
VIRPPSVPPPLVLTQTLTLKYNRRSKLYVFGEAMLDKGSGKKTWLERGIGEVKLLK